MKRYQKCLMSWLLVLAMSLSLLAMGLPVSAVTGGSVEIEGRGTLYYTVTDGKATVTQFNATTAGHVVIPATVGGYPVTRIGNSSFSGWRAVTGVTIPEGVTTIGGSAFISCENLASLVLPASLVSIEYAAFYGCYELDHIFYGGSSDQWNGISVGEANYNLGYATTHYGSAGQELQISANCTGFDHYCTLCDQSWYANGFAMDHTFNDQGRCMLCDVQMRKIYVDTTGIDCNWVTCYRYDVPGPMSVGEGAAMHAMGNDLFWVWAPENLPSVSFTFFGEYDPIKTIYTDTIAEGQDLYIYELGCWSTYNGCGHSFSEVSTPATCTQKGQTVYTCALCGMTAETYTEPLGHQFVARALTEATCTEPGLMTSQCSVCGEVLDWQFPAIGHKYVHTLLEAPTCQSPAVVQHTCEVCGDSYTDDTVASLDDGFAYGYLWAVDAVGQSPEYIVDCITMDWLWNHKCTEEDEYGCYRCVMTVPGDIFEEYLDRFAPLSMILEQVRGKYNVTYDAQAHTYTIGSSGGYGGFTNSRIYAGFVNNGSSYDVYYENVEKEWLTEEGYEYYYALAEELGYYPSSFEFDGKVYHDFGCGEYAHITSHTGTGNKYTVEWYEDQLRIVSMGKFAAGEMPTEFSYSQLWDPASTEHRYVDGKCQVCGRSEQGEAVQVSVTDFGDSEVPVRLELTQEGSTYVLESTGSEFTFEGVAPGSYTLKVSKPNHTTREYPLEVTAETAPLEVKLHLIGDITGDGRISVADVSKAYAQAKKTTPLTGYEFQVADVTGDGRISVADVSKLYAHAKKTTSLW